MRIRTKLISAYLIIALLFSLIGFYGVRYTMHVGELFEGVESDSVPSLTSLMEIVAATRQASIKAMEYSMRGIPEDRTKAAEALEKIEYGFSAYQTTMLDQAPARAQNLDAKISGFMQVIESYLSLGAGPGIADLIVDVDRLHEFRSDLIHAVNEAIKHEPKQPRLLLQRIKSEARKASIKAVEFALRGDEKDKTKAEEALEELGEQLEGYTKNPEVNGKFIPPINENARAYISISHKYLDGIAARAVSIKDIHDMEKQVHQMRRELIHALYPLIEREKQEFREAADETHKSIANSAYILVASIVAVVLIAFAVGVVVAKTITRPLHRLNEAAHQIAMGDLKQELNIRSADEVGELANSFDNMKKELKKHRDHMEELVKARTIALENSNQELESYSYSIAHDLRAPLRSIVGFSQIILEDAGDKLDSVDAGHLQRIIKSATHMGELIDDILELSRVSRSHMQFNEVNLSSICSEISKTLSSSKPERKVEWHIQPDIIVKGDQRLMYMVLSNLLGNAWKFTQQQSPAVVEFGCMDEPEEKVYYVRDNGVGFDMKYADKLFGVFQRLHGSDEYEGTGVGLATVQRIINRHNGWVKAESDIGKGTTIYFSIPERNDGTE